MFKKAALFGLLFLIGACAGSFSGYKFLAFYESAREWRSFDKPDRHEFFRTYDLMARLRLGNMGAAMRLQNPKDSPDRRREYLNLVLDIVQKDRDGLTDPAARTMIDVEAGITYVRLAMLEEAAGNLSASQSWMQKAQFTLKQAGWNDCSEAHLKQIVQAQNKQDSCEAPCGKS